MNTTTHTAHTTRTDAAEIKAIADSLHALMQEGALVASNTSAWKQSNEALVALYALSNAH